MDNEKPIYYPTEVEALHSGVKSGSTDTQICLDLGILAVENCMFTIEDVEEAFEESKDEFNNFTQHIQARLKLKLIDRYKAKELPKEKESKIIV